MFPCANIFRIQLYVAQSYMDVRDLIMVLHVRSELIAYYQRRGYQITGHTEPYPVNANVGQPLVPIQLIEMKKAIIQSIDYKLKILLLNILNYIVITLCIIK